MARMATKSGSEAAPPPFKNIAQRIGIRLRDLYVSPESAPLPAEHVDLLLRLRHKERDRRRATA